MHVNSCSGSGSLARVRRWCSWLLPVLLCPVVNGCASLTNPLADGVPVRRLPPELLDPRVKDDERTIPLAMLEQQAPAVYRVAAGDVLGVWIEGVLGEKTVAPPVNMAPPLQIREQRRLAPAFGYPIDVRENGAITLPMIQPLKVQGMSLGEIEDAVRKAYVKEQILPAGKERVVVTLLHPRQTHVVVMRQESGSLTVGPEGSIGGGKRGTGHVVDLPAYENDVLHALAQTGGLPGLDAYDEVIIFRGGFRGLAERDILLKKLEGVKPGDRAAALGFSGPVIHIPLRARPGDPMHFGPEDVVLQTGDVVFVEARDADLFYTGGLLPPGEHVLPRDVDLDVVQAVLRVHGAMVNGGFVNNQLIPNLIAPGLGGPSPSLLTVLRRTPGGGQVAIRVDLNRALRDARERINVRPGDVLVLQETPAESVTRYLTETVTNFTMSWQVIHDRLITGVLDVAAPERIPSRIGVGTILPR